MLFNSFEYLIFLPAIIVLFFSVPQKARVGLLLGGSYFFYGYWNVYFLSLILVSTILDYFVGLKMEEPSANKKALLAGSLIVNFGLLMVFKYLGFFTESIHEFLSYFKGERSGFPVIQLLLPVGISFYTFQTVGYTLDVYHGRIKAERNILKFALYVSYFPQLVAGPIERAGNLLSQLALKQDWEFSRFTSGLSLILWGLFKKVVIADRLAMFVNAMYAHPDQQTGGVLMLGTVFFAFQVYCDFSAYSDIAIGTSRIFGVDLMKNFNRPYIAASMSEFWKRWHISLSTWFNDYLYTPIALKRRDWGTYAMAYGLLITFLVSGLWHGASWHFVAWGGLHALALIYELFTKKRRKKWKKKAPVFLYKWVSILLTFGFVCFSYVFFRADSIHEAFLILNKMTVGLSLDPMAIVEGIRDTGLTKLDFLLSLMLIGILLLLEWWDQDNLYGRIFGNKPTWLRWACYYFLIIMIVAFGVDGEQQFIYFQF